MIVETPTDLTMTSDAPIGERAVWTAPVLQFFDVVSAEVGTNPYGGDAYASS
jgi:hypothetical protein